MVYVSLHSKNGGVSMIRLPLFRLLLPTIILLLVVTQANANVTGIVRGVQENPIAGALVTFASEANPALTFSGYTNAGGRYDIAIASLAVGDVSPAPFTLHQNHPNPFNPSTTITFSTAEPEFVTLAVYNLLGQRVRTLVSGTMPTGEHAAVWDGRDDAGTPSGAGVYLYRLAYGDRAEVKKMLLLDGGAAGGGSMSAPIPAAPKPAASTWTVTITGDEIEPREMTGLEIADGGMYEFYVIYTGEIQNFHLVFIPGGTFEIGEAWESESDLLWFGPAHHVIISDFEISAYETTNAQYAQFLNEALAAGEIEMISGDPYGKSGGWDGKQFIDLDTRYLSSTDTVNVLRDCFIMYQNGYFKVEEFFKRNWPVVAVTWDGAKAFAVHYGLDLPTEAEWEYAARGGALEYLYATDDGTIDPTKANYTLGHPIEVAGYPSNTFGLYDMTGNVAEWCNDWAERYPSLFLETHIYFYDYFKPPSNPIVNPTGSETGTIKVIRGGYYDCYASYFVNLRTTYRYYRGGGFEYEMCGFRVARDIEL